MLEKKILIAGLPDAGKSTYIAALNGVMSQEGDFCLTPADKASELGLCKRIDKKMVAM